MAGRTHGQHALPVTFGWKCAAWLDELMRHRERLEASRPRVLVGEWGGAVGTLAALGRGGLRVERRLMQRLGLGVPRLPVKTAGDRFAEFFLLAAMLSATLGKIAQNVYNLQLTDVDEVVEFAEGKVGSSAMPHKLNPVASGSVVLLGAPAALARAADARVRPRRVGGRPPPGRDLLGLPARGLPAALGLSSGSASACCATLVVKPENMRRNLDRAGGVVLSEAVMMALAPKLGRGQAHELVRRLHRDCLKRCVPFQEAVRRDPEIRARLSPRRIEQTLDYRNSLGLAGPLVDRVLTAWRRSRQD